VRNLVRSKSAAVKVVAIYLIAILSMPAPAIGQSLPQGWEIITGAAEITSDGAAMTVRQYTGSLITNWESFSIGEGASVTFLQPDSSSVALNRVVGSKPSEILGRLSATGRVFVVNPQGVVFGENARVDAAALVASTIDISDQAFLEGRYVFSAAGVGEQGYVTPGSIVNRGDLRGDVVALIAPVVLNHGTIAGDTALIGATGVLLDFDGSGLIGVRLDPTTLETLVENHGLIQADGGTVVLSARAAGEALGGVVNNTGVIEARRFEERDGRIYLIGDMEHGLVYADGRLAAPFVETSAATVRVGDSLVVDAAGGEWLIDPVNITIDESLATAIKLTMLLLGGVIVSTSPGLFTIVDFSAAGTPGPGDIIVNAPISWSRGILMLEADRHIYINAELTSKGTTASDGLKLVYGKSDPTGDYFINSKVNLAAGSHFSTQKGSAAPKVFRVITSLGNEKSLFDGSLQAARSDPGAYFALGADIDAASTASWNGGLGFEPIGYAYPGFSGIFEGLGHTIYNLHIDRERSSSGNIGLFGHLIQGSAVQNVGLVGAKISGPRSVGGIAGSAEGGALIRNVYVDGSVSAPAGGSYAGGVVGLLRNARLENARSLATVTGGDGTGGLVGLADSGSVVVGGYAAGTVNGGRYTGGLVGSMNGGRIESSMAVGDVTGQATIAGGLVGEAWGVTIRQSGATGRVEAAYNSVGGLVGSMTGGSIVESFATGPVTSTGQYVGGLVGVIHQSAIENSYATGSVVGASYVGGLAGYVVSDEVSIKNVYAAGLASGSSRVGGLAGSRPS